MKIHEYQAKELLRKYGLPIPLGDVAATPAEAEAIAQRIGGTVVVKAQVLIGGRGKAGGVKLAKTATEARQHAQAILGMDIRGTTVRKVLVAKAADIAQELYLSIMLDRAARRVRLMGSAAGGVDIEQVARETPERIVRVWAEPFLGLLDYQIRQVGFGIGLRPDLLRPFTRIAQALYRAFIDYDCTLAEINPLVVTQAGQLEAIDAKIDLDDNGLFRHQDVEALRDPDDETMAEREARANGLAYVGLDGTIGCVVNGAGLAMATMDVIKLSGGEPANFLDVGGGARADQVAAALRIILADERVDAVLFNIFGGITRCDEVARGLLAALPELPRQVPLVVRLVGTNEEEGRRILSQAGITAVREMSEAAKQVVALHRSAAPAFSYAALRPTAGHH